MAEILHVVGEYEPTPIEGVVQAAYSSFFLIFKCPFSINRGDERQGRHIQHNTILFCQFGERENLSERNPSW